MKKINHPISGLIFLLFFFGIFTIETMQVEWSNSDMLKF